MEGKKDHQREPVSTHSIQILPSNIDNNLNGCSFFPEDAQTSGRKQHPLLSFYSYVNGQNPASPASRTRGMTTPTTAHKLPLLRPPRPFTLHYPATSTRTPDDARHGCPARMMRPYQIGVHPPCLYCLRYHMLILVLVRSTPSVLG